MAIVVDPDNLDRAQVIFGTENQRIATYDVGAVVDAGLTEVTDGVTTAASLTFSSASSTFQTDGVASGDVVCMYTGVDAGHFIVDTVDSETSMTLTANSDVTTFTGDTAIVFDVRDPSGGSIADGFTKQALYSFGKEEWKTDSKTFGSDDLIRHPFPFEAITREQMEVGGGTAHDDWLYANDYTRKKVRTGGWARKNNAGTTIKEYSGIITLGSLDADTQAYFQQVDEAEAPVNFDFLGAVNEAIQVWVSGTDNRTYLKLFARKKARTYAGADIAAIGVTSLETIVNRFPLAHAADAAITAADAAILGTSTFRQQGTALTTAADGSKTAAGSTFTSSGSTFQTDGVAAGDCLHITSGTEQGDYTILTVDSETVLTIATDFEFTSAGWTSTESTLSFNVTSTVILSGATDGALADVDGDTGTLTSATGGFTAAVAADDLVIITEAASDHRGVYKVISVDSDTVLTLNTSDNAFTTQSTIDFTVVEPGMYLEYKEEAITLTSTGNITFTNTGNTIERTSGSWITDGVTTGSVLVVTGSTSNNGSWTVKSVDDATTITLVNVHANDAVTDEGPSAITVTAYDAFKRVVNGETYAFHWRLYGIDATLADTYQFIQHQLRQTSDIDNGAGIKRGDVNDLLMTFATPTGTAIDLYVDDLNAADANNVTYEDATGNPRTEKFIASGSISFNTNLQNSPDAIYHMLFLNDDAGDNTGRDFGTPQALTVQNESAVDIKGTISAATSVNFTYDYDGNIQRGAASAGEDAPVVVVALGTTIAQYVRADYTITRSKANNIALVAPLERNFSNP